MACALSLLTATVDAVNPHPMPERSRATPLPMCAELALDQPHGLLPEVLTELLMTASDALERDREITKTCIARAVALLIAEQDARPAARDDSDAKTDVPFRGGLAPAVSRRIVAQIDQNLASTITIQPLAETAKLSTGHFCRAFKGSFGQSPHAYIMRRRVERAQDMMLATDEPLSRIALDCGLADQSHLSRIFRRTTGASPSAWRRAHRTEPRPNTRPPRHSAVRGSEHRWRGLSA